VNNSRKNVVVLLAFTDGPGARDGRNGRTESGAEGLRGAQRQSSFPEQLDRYSLSLMGAHHEKLWMRGHVGGE
jgi:hypothetical protein